MKSLLFLLASICFLFLISCGKNNQMENELITFDVSPQNDKIVFSIYNNNKSNIYISNIEGQDIIKLFEIDSLSFFSPNFTGTGDSIIYISNNYPNSFKTSINIYDIKKKKSTSLFKSTNFIKEATYGESKNIIYYIEAKEFDSYSPIGRMALHNFDLFKYNISDRRVNKVSDLNAYMMENLFFDNKKLFFDGVINNSNGLFEFNEENKLVEKIVIKNDTLLNSTWISNASLINENTILFTQLNEILKLDLKNKVSTKILRSINGAHFSNLKFDNQNNRIYFSERKVNKIYVIDLEGNLLNTIDIIISNN